MPRVGSPLDRTYRKIYPRILGQARKLTGGNSARAEDLTQQAFITFMTIQGRYSPDAPAAPILSKILRNHFLNDLTKASNRREIPQDPSLLSGDLHPLDDKAPAGSHFNQEKLPTALLDGSTALGSSMDTSIDGTHLTLVEGALSPNDQRLFHLLASGYRKNEVAEALGMNPATISQHTSRVYDQVREFQEIITQGVGISAPSVLRTRLRWRNSFREAGRELMAATPGKAFKTKAIIRQAGTSRAHFYNSIQQKDPAARKIIDEAVENSLKAAILNGYRAAKQEAGKSNLPTIQRTAKLAGIDVDKLRRIIREQPELIPSKAKFAVNLRGKKQRANAVKTLEQHLEKITKNEVPPPLTASELYAQLGISRKTLTKWERHFPEVAVIVTEILGSPEEREKKAIARRVETKIKRAAARRKNEWLPKLVEAAKDYSNAHPKQKSVPATAMAKATGISWESMAKLIQEHAEHLKSEGIIFRTAQQGGKLEAFAIEKLQKLLAEIKSNPASAPQSQEDIADRLDIHPITLSSWKKRFPKVAQLVDNILISA